MEQKNAATRRSAWCFPTEEVSCGWLDAVEAAGLWGLAVTPDLPAGVRSVSVFMNFLSLRWPPFRHPDHLTN